MNQSLNPKEIDLEFFHMNKAITSSSWLIF